MPIWISVTALTPLAAQFLTSDALIRREALAMSGYCSPTPEQNSLMPPPVPVDSMTGGFMLGLPRASRSATAVANG